MPFRYRLQNYLNLPWVLALLGGLLLCLPWEVDCWPILFVAWLPWLHLIRTLVVQQKGFWRSYGWLYLATLTWNGASVWWIQGATIGGMLGAVFAMAACMTLVLTLVVQGARRWGWSWGVWALLFGWLGFEYFFHNSEIAWPWLTLGNGLASAPWAIQWYEYTGTLGGSLWVLLVNIMLYTVLSSWRTARLRQRSWMCGITVLLLFAPFVLSRALLPSEAEVRTGTPTEVVVIQPNVDPWREKFSGLTDVEQIERMLLLAQEKITPNTRFVAMPETAIPSAIWLEQLGESSQLALLRAFLAQHPQCHLLIGGTLLRYYDTVAPPTPTAHAFYENEGWYDAYNAALWFSDSVHDPAHYHKSKLVVGVEMMPYPQLLRFLDKISINLGGMVGTLGTQPDRSVFWTRDSVGVAPIICYESVFGEFCTGYVRNGANLLAVITNDGWWGNTPGHRNHFNYAKLRAIETRRWLVRSANTGISGIIDPAGRVTERRGWWVQDAFRAKVYPQSQRTFYVEWGDYIGRIAYFAIALLLLGGLASRLRR